MKAGNAKESETANSNQAAAPTTNGAAERAATFSAAANYFNGVDINHRDDGIEPFDYSPDYVNAPKETADNSNNVQLNGNKEKDEEGDDDDDGDGVGNGKAAVPTNPIGPDSNTEIREDVQDEDNVDNRQKDDEAFPQRADAVYAADEFRDPKRADDNFNTNTDIKTDEEGKKSELHIQPNYPNTEDKKSGDYLNEYFLSQAN